MIISQLTSGFKKEVWEFNKTLFWVPLIIALIIIATPLLKLTLMESYQIERIFEVLTQLNNVESFEQVNNLPQVFFTAITAIFVPFVAASLVIQLYYFTSCMFDERRDLSVYFWRSMPVSDSLTIAVKLITGALLLPAIFMLGATAVILVFILLVLIACIVLSLGFDISLWGIWGQAEIISSVAANWISLFPYSIWMFPVFAWLMLASMFANKAPFLWAILPVAGLLLIESYLVEYFALDRYFLRSSLISYFEFSEAVIPHNISEMDSPRMALFAMIASKISLIGSILGAGLVYLTYWLRVNRG